MTQGMVMKVANASVASASQCKVTARNIDFQGSIPDSLTRAISRKFCHSSTTTRIIRPIRSRSVCCLRAKKKKKKKENER